jgi:hypothetical protein
MRQRHRRVADDRLRADMDARTGLHLVGGLAVGRIA